MRNTAALALGAAAVGSGTYLGLVTGALPIDTGVGRRVLRREAFGPVSGE